MLGVHHSAICTSDVERSLRFWCEGLGLSQLMDYDFVGDWPGLFGAGSDRLRSVFLGDPQTSGSGFVELVEVAGALEALPDSTALRHGFMLLSLQREVDETLAALAALGFTDGVRRIDVVAPDGRTVAMAVIEAPDGVLVELIGRAK
ncbi:MULTISPECIES: VOC family protein [unclassified Mycobacterium]|uniref:VOC family protein n=1 Tax=unclassified Mycobacterium TaxID=2642494 RepID=UPI0009ED72B6|nr:MULTISPECIES: VOC family protein [unclassified Mycobacterium]